MNRFFDVDGDHSTQLAPWTTPPQFGGVAAFRREAALRFKSDIAGGVIVVPVGFLSDLASIPRYVWSTFMAPNDPHIALGSWIHDWLYNSLGFVRLQGGEFAGVRLTRDQCDRILTFEAMPDLGASSFECRGVYVALRLFGGGHWESTKMGRRRKCIVVSR